MQLLFESSCEFGETRGLGLIPGHVVPIHAKNLKIPHMGWNDLKILHPCAMTQGIEEHTYMYFVHSFRADTKDAVIFPVYTGMENRYRLWFIKDWFMEPSIIRKKVEQED